MATSKVLIGGSVFLYKAKAPYEKSGVSILGAIEYNSKDDTLRCHECGDWFRSLAAHLTREHNMKAKQYKIRHGLRVKTALVCEEMRIKMSDSMRLLNATQGGSPLKTASAVDRAGYRHKRNTNRSGKPIIESLNKRKACTAQKLEKLRRITHSLGRNPSYEELKKKGLHPDNIKYTFGNLRNAYKLAGLPYIQNVTRNGKWKKYTDAQLLGILGNFCLENGRLPSQSDARREMLPALNTYVRRFGTLKTATTMAGCAEKVKQYKLKKFLDSHPNLR